MNWKLPYNAITDVPGVQVGHCTPIYDEPRIARTGVTMILPRGEEIWQDSVFAGSHASNGMGEMTGICWLEESGLLSSPIGLTNTFQVGVIRDALVAYGKEKGGAFASALPVVAETYVGINLMGDGLRDAVDLGLVSQDERCL